MTARCVYMYVHVHECIYVCTCIVHVCVCTCIVHVYVCVHVEYVCLMCRGNGKCNNKIIMPEICDTTTNSNHLYLL